MITSGRASPRLDKSEPVLSLYHLLDPDILANPYPLYHRLQTEDPVHWDPYLHAWVVTRYQDVVMVLQQFSANRTPSPEQFEAMDLKALTPLARVMVHQMLFLDAPMHGRIRGLCSGAFTVRRVEALRAHIQDIVNDLLDAVQPAGHMDVLADLANPLPAIVTAEMLGVPAADHEQLKAWSADFAEVLGNFQHNPERASRSIRSLNEMCAYFRLAVHEHREHPRDDMISALVTAEVLGDRLTEEEIVANIILTMVGGQETTTNLIGNGLLTLLRHPDQLELLRADADLISSAVEELLRYESPTQYTARLAPDDVQLGDKLIRKHQLVMVVMGAANRDPERFPDPDRLDLRRLDNRHLAFAWGSHFCFGAPLARIEGRTAIQTMLRRMPNLRLASGPITWRPNLALRGLTEFQITF